MATVEGKEEQFFCDPDSGEIVWVSERQQMVGILVVSVVVSMCFEYMYTCATPF